MITKLSDLNPETLENLHMALANATEEMIGNKTIAEAAKENDTLCRLLSIEHACFEALSIQWRRGSNNK